MAFSGLLVHLGAVATILASKDWPPAYARYQLRRRRWAALRVSAYNWLLADLLPRSHAAIETYLASTAGRVDRDDGKPPSFLVVVIDTVLWPLCASRPVFDPALRVYPAAVERSFLVAGHRGTDALLHERIIHVAGWLGYIAMASRILCAA
jgi:hypothetical protein